MTWMDSLRDEMAEHGLLPADDVVADGEVHRFDVDGDRPGRKNGWYVAFADGRPAAVFGSHRTGERVTWRADRAAEDDGVDREAQRRARQRRERARKAQERTAVARAEQLWRRAVPANPGHPYLRVKAIGPHSIRQLGDLLVVPLYVGTGKLRSLQFIAPNGDKRFLKHTATKGLFHVIGARTPRIWLVEGFATGAALHEDTAERVVVALNCHNLLPVARVVKSWKPQRLAIMADDDAKTDGNPGIRAAEEVSNALGCDWYRPEFPPDRPAWATDFNDSLRLWLTQRASA